MQTESDKWAEWNKLSPYAQQKVDQLATERGETLHAGSTAEEIARAIRIYRATGW